MATKEELHRLKQIEQDAALIDKHGGAAALAKKLMLKGRGQERVQNWKARGIPASIKIQYPEIFLAKSMKRITTKRVKK